MGENNVKLESDLRKLSPLIFILSRAEEAAAGLKERRKRDSIKCGVRCRYQHDFIISSIHV